MNENPNPGNVPTTPPASARDLVTAMRRRSTEHLQAVLARVFARADDWLFDLAKKDGVPDGSPYLHAMRALRTSRAPIERGFRDHLDHGFEGDDNALSVFWRDGRHDIAHIGGDQYHLMSLRLMPVHANPEKRGVLNPHHHFFVRGNQIMPIRVAPQHRGEELDQRFPADRRVHVEPGAVGPDFHVEIPAERRFPAFHRR